jgi:LuxR family quorum sensing-dependent transcriptional regulator
MSRIGFPTLQAFSERCLTAATPAEITGAFDAIMQEQGVLQWYIGSLGFINEHRGFGFDRIPSAWRERYLEADHALHDPVYHHAVNFGGKATWSQCGRVAQRLDDRRGLQVLAEAAECGLRDGLVMPIHGLGDLPAAVSFGGDDLDLSDDAQASFYVVGALAYEGVRRLVEGLKPISPHLSDRELKILRWTAEGKSAEVIALILKLSVHTVREYHGRIRSKYGVATMIQVAVLAALDGNLRFASIH